MTCCVSSSECVATADGFVTSIFTPAHATSSSTHSAHTNTNTRANMQGDNDTNAQAAAVPSATLVAGVSHRATNALRQHLQQSIDSAHAAMANQLGTRGLAVATPAASATGVVGVRERARVATTTTGGAAIGVSHLGEEGVRRRSRANSHFDPTWQLQLQPPAQVTGTIAPLPCAAGQHVTACNTCGKSPLKASTAANGSTSQHSILARCSGCRAVYYCSKPCQRNDWNKHKFLCRHVRTMDVHQLVSRPNMLQSHHTDVVSLTRYRCAFVGQSFLKISSTIPGNFHHPVESADNHASTAAASSASHSARSIHLLLPLRFFSHCQACSFFLYSSSFR